MLVHTYMLRETVGQTLGQRVKVLVFLYMVCILGDLVHRAKETLIFGKVVNVSDQQHLFIAEHTSEMLEMPPSDPQWFRISVVPLEQRSCWESQGE